MEVISGQIYQHFKGDMYKVLCEAVHSETGEKLVIYQALYDESKIFARPYEMFVSKVDKEKYPNVEAEYRFTPYIEEEGNIKVNPKVLEFLDTDVFSEKRRILEDMAGIITNDMINTMAYSLDFELNDGTVDERYEELLNCVLLREKFECGRLRS